jgi:membrane fusion protein (multidrug efflux system)
MKATRTRVCPLLCTAFLLAVLSGCGEKAEQRSVAPPPVAVAVVEAQRVVDNIRETGELLAVNEASVAAEVAGRVTAILVTEGAAVEQGHIVFEIDRERRELELNNARARVEEARANVAQQEREARRLRQLHSSGTASQAELDRAETGLRLARSQLAAAQAALGLAERALRDASVAAPFSGFVARRHVSEGEFVTRGRELFELVSLDPIEIEFSLPERDSSRIAIGQKAEVRVAPFPDEVFTATVTVISPKIDPRSRTLRVKAAIANRDGRLRPGLFARADLGVSERAAVPMVPEGAVLQRADGSVVYRLDGANRVDRVLLTTGIFRDGYVEVLDGLQIGDVVVVRGQARLIDGAVVDVRDRGMAPALATVGDSSRKFD